MSADDAVERPRPAILPLAVHRDHAACCSGMPSAMAWAERDTRVRLRSRGGDAKTTPTPAPAQARPRSADSPVAPTANRRLRRLQPTAPQPSGEAPPVPGDAPAAETSRAPKTSAQRRRLHSARLTVLSTPSRAGVTVNGKWRGRTPLTLDTLPLGTYNVRVVQPGFAASNEDVALSTRQPMRTVSVRLQPVSAHAVDARACGSVAAAANGRTAPPREPAQQTYAGSIFVDSRPRGATILIDGKPAGTTPASIPGHSDRFTCRQARACRSPRLDDQHTGDCRRAGARHRFARTHTMKATLALENGLWYEGDAAGAAGETGGEVVFNTSLTGYQEILTDPSYSGQIVTMTCPGNRQLRHCARRWRVARAAGRRIHHSRRIAGGEQLAVRQHAA